MTKINYYKYILYRIAGESFSTLNKNEEMYLVLRNQVHSLIKLESRIEQIKTEICETLYEYIKSASNNNDRNILINFKRDLFNNRNIQLERAVLIENMLPKEVFAIYSLYVSISNDIILLLNSINTNYLIAYHEDINFVKTISSKDYFKSGLLLSSETLYKYAKEYAHNNAAPDEGKILGLWKYITRTIAKTTPYSTFTQLNMGLLVQNKSTAIKVTLKSDTIFSEVRYNNYIFESILTNIKHQPSLYRFFSVKINPTLKNDGVSLKYFTNNNNNEAFQNIKNNGIINYILGKLNTDSSITYEYLVNDLLSVLDTKYKKNDVEQYIFQLIQTGLLYLEINLSGLDSEWDKSLKDLIVQYAGKEQIGQYIIKILTQLEIYRKDYASSNFEERESLSLKIKTQINELFDLLEPGNLKTVIEDNSNKLPSNNFIKSANDMQKVFLHKQANKSNIVSFDNIVYEDTSKDIKIEVSEQAINPIINKLNQLIQIFAFICYSNHEKVANYYFYLKHFNEQPEVGILNLYELLYKENSKQQQNTTPNTEPNTLLNANNRDTGINIFEQIKQFITKERNSSNSSVNFNNNECEITDLFLENFQNEFKAHIVAPPKMSFSAYLQLIHTYNEPGKLSAILGGILPGKGKMFSRFLHLFPDEITTEINLWNIQTMPENELYVENSDASYFNANLHPGMLPYEIAMPGGNNRSSANQIHVYDLIVKPNHLIKELELYNKDGKKIVIFDLGFQSLFGRSHLYRLLNLFGNNYGYSLPTINGYFNGIFAEQKEVKNTNIKIIINPRITFGTVLILQRKNWIVPVILFQNIINKTKFKEHTEKYLNIQKWRIDIGIPDEVFIRLYHTNAQTNAESGKKQNMNRDDYKPQYINFLSPISIKLFIKIANKTTNANLLIEEMLPNRVQQLKIENNSYTTEALINWE